jgi:hypothetical protein
MGPRPLLSHALGSHLSFIVLAPLSLSLSLDYSSSRHSYVDTVPRRARHCRRSPRPRAPLPAFAMPANATARHISQPHRSSPVGSVLALHGPVLGPGTSLQVCGLQIC